LTFLYPFVMPTFSVIIPVYNAEAYIEQTLASAFAQTFSDFEVIVIDDGSTDDTAHRVNTFSHYDSLRYIHQANAGPAAARNTGLNEARGQWIAFLDSDDLWHPRKLEAHFKRMQNSPQLGMSFNWFQIFYDRPEGEQRSPWFAPPRNLTLNWEDFLLRNWTGTSSTVVIRTESLGQHRFDARFRTGEDYQLWMAIAQDGWEVGFIPTPLTLYRKRPSSLTVDYLQIALDELFVMEAGVRSLDDHAKAAIDRAITRRQVDVAWAYFRSGQRKKALQLLQHSYQAVPQFLAERVNRKFLHRPCTPLLPSEVL
jgi:teichuronic acid biosynthesis glycosyltransferase TuaG